MSKINFEVIIIIKLKQKGFRSFKNNLVLNLAKIPNHYSPNNCVTDAEKKNDNKFKRN